MKASAEPKRIGRLSTIYFAPGRHDGRRRRWSEADQVDMSNHLSKRFLNSPAFSVREPAQSYVQMSVPRRPTVFDVAQLANVSIATVSRVLHTQARGEQRGRFSKETAEKVLDAARMLGYQPSELGRSLRTAKTRLVAFLVPDVANDFCADVAVSLQAALRSHGLAMMLCNAGEDPDVQDEYLSEIKAFRVTAMVMLAAFDTPGLRVAVQDSTPFLFVNRRPPKGVNGHFVGIDNRAAGRHVAEYFLTQKYTDCAIIHWPHSDAVRERVVGFIDRLAEAGVAVPSGRRIEARLTIEDGYRQAKKLLSRSKKPRALFCGNDQVAYGVYRACGEAGLRVHDDVAIFGFDDNHINEWLAPWLNTVHVPATAFGPAIADLLVKITKHHAHTPREVLLPFELNIRRPA